MLVGELSHRVKNMLAVVQSIAFQTARHSPSLDAFSNAFQGRLQALATANDAIIRGNWKGVRLHEIVERALDPFGAGDQVTIAQGPAIDLRPQASLALAMILHELATNAVKYGALSVPAGKVGIGWKAQAAGSGDELVMEWTERSGPAIVAPLRKGQGTRFIKGSIAHELKGKATLNFEPSGLSATLSFPLTAAVLGDDSPLDDSLSD